MDIEQIASLERGQKLPLQRDVEAIAIPFGKTDTLAEDSIVSVMQAKGSSVSVGFEGRLYLIEGRNLDALGLESLPRPTLPESATDEEIEQFVWDQLRTCFDPEIPVNIVDLGLGMEVTGCIAEEQSAADEWRADSHYPYDADRAWLRHGRCHRCRCAQQDSGSAADQQGAYRNCL